VLETEERRDVLTATLVSFAVIFVAELGDKSQLMALTFATRYRAVPVLIGITVATAIVHAVSVVAGAALGATIPTRPVTLIAGLAFVAFGLWTLRGDRLTEEDEARAARPARHVVLTVGAVFFLAELGDKTMLATITLATREGLLGTWLGSTVGMVVADALAIGVGRVLGTRLPERTIRIAAAVSFFVFAAVLLWEAAVG
jgi:putative Ca2+/H+ antiporter (TMEM165/GDT1 family)